MAEGKLEQCVQSLGSLQEELEATLKQISVEQTLVKQQLKSVRAAKAALGVKKEKKGAASGNAPTKASVLAAIKEVLTENGVVPEADLKSLVEEKLLALGKTKQGFGLRFSQALKSKELVESPAGVRLATEESEEDSKVVSKVS